jgi:hypothetical protein
MIIIYIIFLEILDGTVGIHPVNAEWFTGLDVTKRSGAELKTSGC